MSDPISILLHQRARGPLPAGTEGLSSFIARQSATVRVEVQAVAVSRLRAAGIVVEEGDGRALAHVPADGDVLDRIYALVGLPAIEGGGAALLLAALESDAQAGETPPEHSLPLRIQPAKASSLGWSSDLFSLTVVISNVALHHGTLQHLGGPIVALCAEYDRPLASLDPPALHEQAQGIPMLRLPVSGWLRRPLRLEPTPRGSRAPRGRPAAVARAAEFFDQLGEAWQKRIGSVLEVAWPVYRPARAGPLLDGVIGRPLPEMSLG